MQYVAAILDPAEDKDTVMRLEYLHCKTETLRRVCCVQAIRNRHGALFKGEPLIPLIAGEL